MKKRQWIFGGMALAVLLLGGCHSPEYYQERAVNRAREYLLKQCRTLTPLQREYVKFNKPLIMSETLLGDSTGGGDVISPHARVHFNIAWVIPGKDEIHMVFGVSEPSMAMWLPERLIIKEFVRPDLARDNAVRAGRRFALNTLLDLELGDINRIRFTPPEFFKTDYKLDLDYKERGITEQEAKALTKLTQHSMAWDGVNAGEKIVVVGLGQPNLGGWKPMISMSTTGEELQRHVRTGEPQPDRPPPEPVKPPAAATPKPEVERLLEELIEENKG